MINKSKEATYFESFEANHYSYDTIYSTNMTGNCATFAIDGIRKVAITLPNQYYKRDTESVETFQEVNIFEERSKDALKEVELPLLREQ